MGRKPTNNPRQLPIRSCGCPTCTAKFRPGTKATRRDCTAAWQYRYTTPGGKETSLTRDTYKQAVADGQAAATRVREGTWVDPMRGRLTLNGLRAIYTPLRKVADNTEFRDDNQWGVHIEPHFGSWKLAEISHEEIQAWVNSLEAKLAASSIIKVFQILDKMLAFAMRTKRIPFNPADGIILPTVHAKHPEDVRPPTYAQLRLLRRRLPKYIRAFQIVAQETGLRWGELVGLRRCWVDLDAGLVQVREVIIDVNGRLSRKAYPKEDASMRTVPLTPLARRVLALHLAYEKPATTTSTIADGMHAEELVFRSRNRRNAEGELYRAPMRRASFGRTWNKAAEEAGIARLTVRTLDDGTTRTDHWPHFHDQRHTVASHLADMGVPEVIVQELLGHKRASAVTWLYTHAAADAAEQVLAAFADRHRGQGRHLRVVA